ncbi:AAA family ATPase [Streptomyces sp. enrichment culture]|uniref:AAA family ATPase n=1 Tax=Streptomyces sp. enrichment culture TaxID=1795815 RepID=UPI003F579C24
MTAPLTPPPPPNDRSSHRNHPLMPPPAGAHPTGGAYGQDGPGLRTEVREALVTAVGVTLAGVLLGVLWWRLAPSVPLVGEPADGNWVVYLKDTEGEQAVGVDGTFTLLALAFGAVSAVLVFLLRRRGGVPLVVALGVGGVLGSLLAWRVGVWLGPGQDVIAHAKEVGRGVTFPAPLQLGAKGALLAWSLAALLVHLGLTALFGPRDPDPYRQGPFSQDPHGEPHDPHGKPPASAA